MAKKKAGLPEGYDIRVTRDELQDEPASLMGYLDERPRYDLPVETARPVPPQVAKEPAQIIPPTIVKKEEVVQRKVLELKSKEHTKSKPPRERIKRIQINLTPEIERKQEELLELLGRQSPDGRVTVSELMQALILNLYDARDNINGRLPDRGRWGSASAKSYPAELAIILREAILKDGKGKGMGSFRSAIGQ